MNTTAQSDETGAKASTRRREPKEFRRDQLIQATIDSLATRGFAATTLADVATGAGLSRGIVNFHFESKEKLLLEVLTAMTAEYEANWRAALDKAKGKPAAQQMHALIASDFDARVCSTRLVTAWFGFWAEARTRPQYQELCWARDEGLMGAICSICAALKDEAGYEFDVNHTGGAIYAVQEGLWLRLMLGGKDFKRRDALATALALLGTLFPRHFTTEGQPLPELR